MANNGENNDEDIRGKKNPEIEIDPITGKITVKSGEQSENTDIKSNKDTQQSRKKLIEPHHSPDDPGIQEDKERKKNIFMSLSQKILGNQGNNMGRNLDIAQNIGNRLNRMGVKFLGHVSVGKTTEISPNAPVTGKKPSPGVDNDRNI